MRANHRTDPPPATVTVRGRGPVLPGGRLPGPRRRLLAVGGAMLAPVWGLGFGIAEVHADTGAPVSDLVSRVGAPALLTGLTEVAGPVLEPPATAVGQVLQDRIRAGGLPLPGQATAVPDAFAIAAVLAPAVPAQPSTAAVPRARAPLDVPDHTEVPAAHVVQPAVQVAAAPREVRTGSAAQPQAASPQPELAPAARGLTLTAATPAPTETELTSTAVLVPIAAGLLLTGAAMYKHRGLPRGH